MRCFTNWKTALVVLGAFAFTFIILPGFTAQVMAADTPTSVAQVAGGAGAAGSAAGASTAGAAGGAATAAGISAGTITAAIVAAYAGVIAVLSATSDSGTTTSHHGTSQH